MKPAVRFVCASFGALFVALVTYVHGFWAGHFLDLRATSEYCTEKPLAAPPTSWNWFPLKHACRWGDGTTTELVPAYVNPILFLALTTAVACVVLAITAARRDRAGNP